jgi:hypothetical protein
MNHGQDPSKEIAAFWIENRYLLEEQEVGFFCMQAVQIIYSFSFFLYLLMKVNLLKDL